MIREIRRKEKQDKHVRKVTTTMIVVEQGDEREFTRQQRATFFVAWSSTIKKTWDKFHHNFKEGMWVHPLGYKGVNLGWTIDLHKHAQQ